MTTARDIIKRSMQKVGILVKGELPDDDEMNDALDSLNDLIDSLSNDSLILYSRTWETFNLVGGTVSYTIGTGDVFNTVRPMQIVDSYIKNSPINYPITVVNDETYNSISYPQQQGIPEFLNFDNGFPDAIIRLYPVPSSNYQLFLLTEKAISEFATLDAVVSLPPGWKRLLIYNLALELAPEYKQQPDAGIFKIAAESLGKVKLSVAKARTMDANPSNLQVRNIFSGWRN